ncbi:MAG: PucR family transcriptional regulator [Oscillospiraceae bacterium]
MDLISTKDLACKWNISARRINLLCNQGRVPGAEKVNGRWLIPASAAKPEDLRTKESRQGKISSSHDPMAAKDYIPLPYRVEAAQQGDLLVRDLFNFPYFQDWRLVGGGRGVDHPITSLNMMESPDVINWVKSGQFIISTGYCIRDDIKVQKQIILDLSRAGCAGLAIKIMRFFRTIPQHMIDLAEEQGFPLFEIPDNYNISEVMNNINQTVYAKKLEEMEIAYRIFNTFAEAAVSGSEAEVIRQLGMLAHSDVVASYLNWRRFASYISPTIDLQAEELAAEETPVDFTSYQIEEGQATKTVVLERERTFYRHLFPICYNGLPRGYISIWNQRQEMARNEKIAARSAANIIAILLEKKHRDAESQYSQKEIFLLDEICNRVQSERVALSRASAANMDTEWCYRCIILKKIDNVKSKGYTDIKAKEAEILKQEIRVAYPHSSLIQVENNLVAILGQSGAEIQVETEAFVAFVREKLWKNTEALLIGIGGCYPISKLHVSYKQAKEAIKIYLLRKNEYRENIIYYDSIKVPAYLITMEEEKRHDLHKRIIKRIEEYDFEHGSELLWTMKAYFRNNANISQTARQLFIHRNTLLFRLEKIENLLGVSFDNQDDLFMMNMALRLQPYKES